MNPSGQRANQADTTLVIRLAFLAGSAFLLATGFRVFPWTGSSAISVVVTLSMYLGALTLAIAALLAQLRLRTATLILAVAFLLGATASVAYGILFEIPTYGTDVMTFTHAGGETLLRGDNPYSATIEEVRPILDELGYRDSLTTPTEDGQALTKIIYYPGGHVLSFTLFLALGLDDLRWVTFLFEVAAFLVVWLMVSPVTRLLLPMVLALEPFLWTIFTGGGTSDWVWVLPLVVSAWMLGTGRMTWAGFWLGIACAVKQHPWFAVPFVAVYVYKETRDEGLSQFGVFLSMLGLGFLLPNLPFIVWNPSDWIEGILGPATLDLVPAGSGLSLLVSQGWVEASRATFTFVMVMIGVGLVISYWFLYRRLKDLLWLLPPVILFFSHRSLHSYFVYWLPLVVLWLDMSVTQAGRAPTGSAIPDAAEGAR